MLSEPVLYLRLYLALYEECATYQHHGHVGNVALTRAGYGHLAKRIDEEL